MMDFLFGGSKTAEKVIDASIDTVKGVGAWIDEQEWTEEEKSANRLKLMEQHYRFVELTQQENSIRSVTRRYLSYSITAVALGSFVACSILAGFGYSGLVTEIIKLAEVFHIGTSFLAVVGLYFGVQFLRK